MSIPSLRPCMCTSAALLECGGDVYPCQAYDRVLVTTEQLSDLVVGIKSLLDVVWITVAHLKEFDLLKWDQHSPSKKKNLVAVEEHAEKPLRNLQLRRQTVGVQIRDTPGVSVSKRKAPVKTERSKGIELLSEAALLEEAQLKKAIKRSKRETNIHQAGGSSEGAGLELEGPDEQKGKSSDTSEGTGLIPGVPDVSKADSSKSEYESWGDSDDDNDDDDQQSDDEQNVPDNPRISNDEEELTKMSSCIHLKTMYLLMMKMFGINKWYQSFALRNFDLEDMELESTNSGPTAKLPILKLGEYEMWVIRIKQYFQIQDYALWEVIENGDSWVSVPQTVQENGTSVTKMSIPVTAEEKTNKKNDVKARSLLLMALPNEHQLTFSQYPDAKSMFAAIETRFGGNAATKKTQKTLLKQQYENFSATSAESLDSIFNRLQKIVSRLAILGVVIAQEDLNSKFLSSLPPEWNTHVVVWMNKLEVETMSIDDLYNNFKIIEQKIRKSVGGISTASPNVNAASPQVNTASVSDNTVYAFMVENPNGSNVLHQDLEQIHEDDLEAMDLKWQLSLLSVRAKKYYQRTGKKIFINANDIAGKQGNNEDKSSKAMLAIDGVGFDWSDMAEEQVQTNMALMAFSDSEVYTDKTCSKTCLKNYETLKKQCDDLLVKLNESEFKATTYKRGLATLEDQIITYKKNEVLFSEEIGVLKREVACKDYEINMLKSEFEKVKQEKDGIEFKIEKFDKASKDLDQLLGSQISDKCKKGLGYSAVPLPHPLIYNRPNKIDLSYSGLDEFKEPKFKGYGPKDNGPKDSGPENSKQKSNVVSDKKSDNSKENSEESLVEEQVSQDTSSFVESSSKVDKETVFPVNKKVEFTKPKNHEKPVKRSVRYAEIYRSQPPRGNQRNWNKQKSNQLGKDFVMYNKACFICGSFNHLQINYDNH
ncbi:hypothetical protein Tco_0162726 [Tanacetum coccineum]